MSCGTTACDNDSLADNRPVQGALHYFIMVGLFLSTEIHKGIGTTPLRREVLFDLVPQLSCVVHEIAQKWRNRIISELLYLHTVS